jgi:acyl dehydratase
MSLPGATPKFDDIAEGLTRNRTYRISPAVYEAMVGKFEDRNPLHVDDEFARVRGFESKVMHGAILQGFLSHFVGMVFPGRDALLLSSQVSYLAPSYLGDELDLEAEVTQKVETQRVVVMKVIFQNVTRGQAVARGVVQVRIQEPA